MSAGPSAAGPSNARPPADVNIDRLNLRVTGMDPIDARALARAVALGLAPTLALAPGEAAIDRLAVEVQAKAGDTPEELAARTLRRLAPLLGRLGPGEAGR